MTPKSRQRPPYNNPKEDQLLDLIQNLHDFEEFQKKVLPAIRQDMESGMDAKSLREKYHAIIQARQITAALLETDHAKAASISQQVIDRTEGKSVERQEVKHKFQDLPDQELDAVLNSMLKKAKSETELSDTEH